MAKEKTKYIDPFALFANQTYTAKLESLNGGEVEYRKLTASESDFFQAKAMESVEFDDAGNPQPKIDEESLSKAANIKYEKLALILVTPEKTVDELKGMSKDIIADLVKTILNEEVEVTDDEGNSEN